MTDLLDEFGSLACKVFWETMSNIDFDQMGDTAQVAQGGLGSLGLCPPQQPSPENKKIKIKLRYKKLFKTQQKIRKNFPIVLRQEQHQHQERLCEILEKSPFAFDFSMMGTGKTYVSSKLFQIKKYEHLICVVPSSVKTKWQYMYQNHGVDLDALISYSELRSKKFHQPKHGLLVRRDSTKTVKARDGNNRLIDVTYFEASDLYINRVKAGMLLVIDEIQNIKNTNDQLLACRALVKPILDRYGEEQEIINQHGSLPDNFKPSRILLLSGSPMDKKSQVIHFYRCLGIMRSERLRVYNPFLGIKHDTGITEIRSYFQRNFPLQYKSYCYNFEYSPYCRADESVVDLENRCYSLFQRILKPQLSSSMDPLSNSFKLNLYNGFFPMESHDLQLLYNGIDSLERATNYNSQFQTVDFGHDGVDALRNIQRALVMIETSKINLLAKLAKNRLETNPNQKVVIAVNYTETIVDLMELLKDYCPLRLTGEVTSQKRYDILERFQAHSTEHRLIIGNITVLSTGIDLDDTHGKFPRVALVNPNYNAIGLYQFGYRFHRVYTRSDSEVYFVFGKDLNTSIEKTELPILDSLAKKGNILAETCDNQRLAGIKFPGTYPRFIDQ